MTALSKKPASPRPGEPITLVRTSQGQYRYRTVLDYAPAGMPRRQRRATFLTLTEARAHVARVKADRGSGRLPTRDGATFNSLADEFLAEKKRKGLRPVTLTGYGDSLDHARRQFGTKKVGDVSVADIERLAGTMDATGLTRRTAALCLGLVRAVLARALRQGVVLRNVADGVEAHGRTSAGRKAMSLDEVQTVAEFARSDRLAAGWALTLAGLRRSEVLGLRWQDIDLSGDPATLTVRHGRVGDSEALTPPKRSRSARTLPLPPQLAAALRDHRKSLADSFGLNCVSSTSFVIVDAAGSPIRPELYSDEWRRLCHRSGISRRVILHEARHSSVTTMRAAGLPDRAVAAWHGHSEATMRATYDHVSLEDLTAVARLVGLIQGSERSLG